MRVFVIAFALTVLASYAVIGQYRKFAFQQPKMGSPFNIIIYAEDSAKAATAANHAFLLVDTLNQVYSDYEPNSELNQLCNLSGNGKYIKVSPLLYDILLKAKAAARQSNGSFDVTLSPVVRIWRTARKQQKLPNKDSIMLAMRRVGYRFIEIDTVQKRVRLTKPKMQIDLGGIAKGETAQRVYNYIQSAGFPHSLVDAGGDVVAGTTPVNINGWRVAINLPETEDLMDKQLLLSDMAVTTSGNLYQYLLVDGVKYSHIIDPATGWAVTNNKNVTVIADNGTLADWLTKACTIMPIRKALKLVARYPNAQVQIALIKNQKVYFHRSKGFAAYFK